MNQLTHYTPSGRINPIRYAAWTTLGLGIACLLGFLQAKLLSAGHYYYAVGIVYGLILTGVAYAVTRFGHCRNRLVAAAMAIAVALVGSASFYQFDMAEQAGYDYLTHLELLPNWLEYRFTGESTLPTLDGTGQSKQLIDPSHELVQALLLSGIFCFTAIMPAATAWGEAGRPYSEQHHQWMTTHVVPLKRGSGAALIESILEHDPLDEVREYVEPSKGQQNSRDELALDYVPGEADSPILVSYSTVRNAVSQQSINRETIMRQVVLTPEQAHRLASVISIPGAKVGPDVVTHAPVTQTGTSGRVFELPHEDANQIMTAGTKYWALTMQLAPMTFGLIVGIAVGIATYSYWDSWPMLARLLVPGAAGTFFVLTLIYTLSYEETLPGLVILRKARAVIDARTESVVNPWDEEVTFVEVIPRAHWPKLMVENSTDRGLLQVDEKRRAILFEGDRERWVIPAESVISCEIEEFVAAGGEANRYNHHAVVVLQARVDDRIWEAPLCVRASQFQRWHYPQRRALARQLLWTIKTILE